MTFTSTFRKAILTGAVATAATVALASAPASAAVSTIGNRAPDAGAQAVSMGSVACTVNGGDPVTVSINGVRHIRSTATLTCNVPVHVRASAGGLYTPAGLQVQNIQRTPLTSRTSVSVVSQRACRNAANTYWTGVAEFEIDMNRDGYIDAHVIDASAANLRSCS